MNLSGATLEVSWSGAVCGSCELTIYRDGWPLCVRSAEGESGTLYFDIGGNPGTYKARMRTESGCVTSGEVVLTGVEEPERLPEPSSPPEPSETQTAAGEPAIPQNPSGTPDDAREPQATEQENGEESACEPGESEPSDCESTPEAGGDAEPSEPLPGEAPTPTATLPTEPEVTPTAMPTVTATPAPTIAPTPTAVPTVTATPAQTIAPTPKAETTFRVTAGPTATPTAKPVHTSVPTAAPLGETRSTLEEQVVAQVNAERARQGLQPLSVSAELNRAAAIRGAEIAVSFSHTRPDGTSWTTVSDSAYGENIAMGQRTADKAMAAWMSSPGHRANILHASYGTIGVCAYVSGGVTYWVQLFGR